MGEMFAVLCAVAWSLAVILFRKSGQTVPPLAMNLFRVTVSSVVFLATLLVLQKPLLNQAPVGDYLILALSGVIAIAISDTLFHACLNRVGAGLNAIIDSLYAPSVVVSAWLLLGERISAWQLAGMVAIISSVALATRVKLPPDLTRRELLSGIAFGVGAMATLGLGIVIAKPVLERSDVLWATTVRQLSSLAVLLPAVLVNPGRGRLLGVFRPNRSWRYAVPGTLLGSYLALLMWIAAFKLTAAGTAAILNQTSTIFILVLASLLLKEPFTRRKALAAVLALGGIALVVLS